MKTPLLQSKEWEQLLRDFGTTTFLKQTADYSYLAQLKSTPVGSYLYVPYGPVAETPHGIKEAHRSLLKLAHQYHTIFVRVEPQSQDYLPLLKKIKAKKSHDLNPADTWVLDLTGNREELLKRLPKRLLRYHRTAPNKGSSITTSKNPEDIHYLVDLQSRLAKQKDISTFSEEYLATELKQDFATLYLVQKTKEPEGINPDQVKKNHLAGADEEYKRSATGESRSDSPRVTLESATASDSLETLAAGLVFDHDGTRYNLQGAQSSEGARLHATGILTIQLILDAHEQGIKEFDFWGIAPDGAPSSHPWAGFTKFKKSFDGTAKHYCGTWDIVQNTTKYQLYNTLRKVNRFKRKLKK